jgi:lincosamide nucleotidyltransferase A/C/D/E
VRWTSELCTTGLMAVGVSIACWASRREHTATSTVVPRFELERVAAVLLSRGYAVIRDWLPAATAFRDRAGREVDVHPVDMTADVGGYQVLVDGQAWHYAPPVEGSIGARPFRCSSAEDQLLMHQGYDPRPVDFADVRRIAQRFGLPVPAPFSPRRTECHAAPMLLALPHSAARCALAAATDCGV